MADTSASALMEAYAYVLWQRIQVHRPPGLGLRGTTQVAFRIDRAGRLVTARIAVSSGIPMLDRAALRTVNDASPFPEPPAELAEAQLEFLVPVNFR